MNDKIQADRQVALDILKPSSSQLEHGLALHNDALVVEPYCLGLRTAGDPDRIDAIVKRGGTHVEIKDASHEMVVLNWARTTAAREEYRQIWEATGVDAVFQNAGEEGNDPVRLLKRFATYTCLIESMPDYLRKIVRPDDIPAAKAAGQRAIGMACNGVPLPGDFRSLPEELSLISVYAKLGMRIVHLTYNRRNPLGDGCGERANGGLSDFGRHAIHELNRWGVMIDIAHTGWQTCLDAIEASERPVVVSHSTVCALHETIRGKPDEVIKALIDKGGVMGITNVPGFLGGTEDIAALLDHVDYMVNTFGADSVCIGTDAGYRSSTATAAEEVAARNKSRPRAPDLWEGLWPDGKFGRTNPEGTRSLTWTNWPLYTVGLVQRGHSDQTIRKILGGNLMRVFRDIWEGSELDKILGETAVEACPRIED